MATYNPRNYKFSTELSYGGVFPIEGFLSQMTQVPAYSSLMVSFHSETDTILRLYKSNTINETNKVKIYEKAILANEKFIKKIPIDCDFLQLEINNTLEEESNLYMNCGLLYTSQFSSQKWLQSIINDDDNLELNKVTNDFYDDVIRGGFQSYEKITINGILRENPSGVVTIGLDDDYRYNEQFSFANITVQSTNDNYPAGTGARVIKIAGVLGSGEEFTQNVNLVTGTSSLGLAIMSIHHMEVIEAGSLHQNDGDITIYGAGGDVLGFMEATRNRALNAYYKVPINKCLVIKDVHVFGLNHGGTLKIVEYNPTNDIEFSLGEFIIEQTDIEITVPLHRKIESLNVLKINYDPTGGGTGTTFKINVIGNGILYPTLNDF